MPRTARAIQAGFVYHVLNRGNGRMHLFHKDADFGAFERVLAESLALYPVDLLTYCLMGNHWHLVVRPRTDTALGQWMGWVGVTHVRRHHAHYHTRGGGHLYQGRFKSFPVQDDSHFLTLCRYVEANALRAGLVKRAEDWPWCGLHARRHHRTKMKLTPWPVDRPPNWIKAVNQAIDEEDLTELRTSVNRGRPWGEKTWVQRTAHRLNLTFTLRNAGRPRKKRDNQ
ncbi:MAG: transposase [Sedimentisphaerales bacterium]|nr:transposase [Sedimentisphaerales bacterium]